MPDLLGRRVIRGTMYALLATSGLVSFFLDLAFFDNLVNASILLIGAFLLIGGLVSGVGHLSRVVVIEKAGYPLTISALGALSIVLFTEAHDNAARLFIGLITSAFTLGLYGRGRDLSAYVKVQRTLQTGAKGDGSE